MWKYLYSETLKALMPFESYPIYSITKRLTLKIFHQETFEEIDSEKGKIHRQILVTYMFFYAIPTLKEVSNQLPHSPEKSQLGFIITHVLDFFLILGKWNKGTQFKIVERQPRRGYRRLLAAVAMSVTIC